MFNIIIEILKIIISALNKRNLLSGKENNKINRKLDKFIELQQEDKIRRDKKLKSELVMIESFQRFLRKFRISTTEITKSLDSIDSADK